MVGQIIAEIIIIKDLACSKEFNQASWSNPLETNNKNSTEDLR